MSQNIHSTQPLCCLSRVSHLCDKIRWRRSQSASKFLFLRQTLCLVDGRPPPVLPSALLFQYPEALWGLQVPLGPDHPARKEINSQYNGYVEVVLSCSNLYLFSLKSQTRSTDWTWNPRRPLSALRKDFCFTLTSLIKDPVSPCIYTVVNVAVCLPCHLWLLHR